MALLVGAFFDTVGEGQGSAEEDLEGQDPDFEGQQRPWEHQTELVQWAQSALQTPGPQVLRRPPSEPYTIGFDCTCSGTESLACHYFGVNYKVACWSQRGAL